MRLRGTVALVSLEVALAVGGGDRSVGAALEVVVTSTGDSVVTGESQCPSASTCTLRRAIELVNADASGDTYTIRFDPAAFDPDAPPPLHVLTTPLPPITRDDVTVDGSGAGVVVDGSELEEPADGIVVAGAGGVVRDLEIRAFGGVCLSLTGAGALAAGSRFGDCSTGILVTAEGATVRANIVGFATDGATAAPVNIGILVNAGGARIGDADGGPSAANIVGNAGTAIRVGEGLGPEFGDVEVAGNILGKAPVGGAAAPLVVGVEIRPPARGVRVLANAIANAGTGVAVGANIGDLASVENRISANRFEAMGGLSIDLGANGAREVNDPGDADLGPNTLLNYAVITRATQSRIQGSACPGCRVELYLAAHEPGGEGDYGTTPVSGGALTTDASGFFELNSPPLVPGQWIAALAIDTAGNTSEFSPSARVGSGVAQCGNVALGMGWNLVGYFGTASLPLGDLFPPGSPTGTVTAIYHLLDGSASYQAWFENGGVGRTLDALESGEAYWMHARQPDVIAGGFSLTVALPVTLKPGWNEFVYIGASVDIRDALASIAAKYTSIYRWSNAEAGGRWRTYHTALPSWAQGFTTLETCGAYSIFVIEEVTLVPPQP